MAYIEFLPCRQKSSKLWIGNAFNCTLVVAEMQLRDGPIQGIIPPMCFTLIFLVIGGLFGILSELFVSTVSAVADDVLRAPDVCVDFFFRSPLVLIRKIAVL